MKSNYMRAAEIKIAKNPDMDWWDKSWLEFEARQKEKNLKIKLGMANTIYIPAYECTPSRGLRAQQIYIIDEDHDPNAYARAISRENIERVIDHVHATPVSNPALTAHMGAFLNEYYGVWGNVSEA